MHDSDNTYRVTAEIRRDGLIIAMLATMLLAGAVALGHLPARVPTHFALNGRADGWSSPVQAAFLPVLLALALWAVFLVLPLIDPRRRSYGQFAPVYRVVRTLVVASVLVSDGVTLLGALGVPIDRRIAEAFVLTGVLVVLGNLLPRVRPTWFVGIRTPWTLSNDEVWRRTHRLAGRLLVLFGLLPLLAALLDRTAIPVAIGVAVLVPVGFSAAYSWWLFERVGRAANG